MKFTWPDKSQLSKGAFEVIRILCHAGFESYIAGGAVRDALLRRPIFEIDIATAAKPAWIEKLFAKTIPTGKKHGTITALLPLAGKERARGRSYEITTFRVEGLYENARRPKSVKFVTSAEIDAKRRDFTVNALFFDPHESKIIDYVSGIDDLRRRQIRLVGDTHDRIAEDALRMLRAVRLATVLDFEIEKSTRQAIQKNASLIQKISAERIKSELDKIMLSDRPAAGIGALDIFRLLEPILPELKKCQGITQPKMRHAEGDVYTHSLLALEQVNEEFDLATRYAVLFHDLGKPLTRKIRRGKITFYGHQDVGVELVKKIGKRLKFSAAGIEKITSLVKAHMVPNEFLHMKRSTRRKWGLTAHFADLLRVYWADASATLSPSGQGDHNPVGYREGQKILKEIMNIPALRLPIISGNEVMRVLRIAPGPAVGKVLRAFEEKKLSGAIKTKKSALEYLRKHKKLFLSA